MDSSYCYSVGLDCELKRIDFSRSISINSRDADNNLNNTELILGQHNEPINKIIYDNERKIAITVGWDKFINLWDYRDQNYLLNSIKLDSKVSSMCLSGSKLVLNCYNNSHSIKIFDLK